jgi:hypothetical protein
MRFGTSVTAAGWPGYLPPEVVECDRSQRLVRSTQHPLINRLNCACVCLLIVEPLHVTASGQCGTAR